MKVVIDASLFLPGAVSQLELVALIQACRVREHAVAIDPPRRRHNGHPTDQWLNEQSPQMRNELAHALDRGAWRFVQASVESPRICVVNGPTCWAQGVADVADAQKLLLAPLHLLVENSRNDRVFVLAVLTAEHCRQLLHAEQRGRVEFEHAGGIGEMRKRLDALSESEDTPTWVRRLRTWVMHDRDVETTDQRSPSPASAAITKICTELSQGGPWKLVSWQLGRRTIESYLPTSLLNSWVERPRNEKRSLQRKAVTALKQLRDKQPTAAWAYDMKRGLRSALKPPARKQFEQALRTNTKLHNGPVHVLEQHVPSHELDSVFHVLCGAQRGALALGFGERAHEAFAGQDSNTKCGEEYDKGPADQWSRESIGTSILDRI